MATQWTLEQIMNSILYCPCENDLPDPCPACGATVAGNDSVSGVCQAKYTKQINDFNIILVNKNIDDNYDNYL